MATPTQADIDKLQEQIDTLNQKLDEMGANMEKIDKSSSSISENIGSTNNLLGDAVRSVTNIRKEFSQFATDTQEQYKYAEKLAESSKETAVKIGISVGRSKEFTKSFNRATAEVQKFGGSAADVQNIMEEIAEQSGRSRIISPEEISSINIVSKSLGLTVDSAAELYEQMSQMGLSADDFSEHIASMTVESQKLGLNASKVAQTLQNNFGRMSTMSFSNGVKGMTEMAKLAVKMRMEVGEMLGMAEKFYEPEAAIEAASNLQMLGGDIANAFGDPFETMYLARNKPEELAKKVGTMVENMMQFNQETGEYEFPPEARMQLKAAGDQLGINVDSMIEMARQSSKIKDIKMNVSGNITDEDMREGIASMAKMKDGKWVVDFKGEEIGIDQIGQDMAEEILAAPKDEKEALIDIAQNSMTTNQILEHILESMKTGFVAESNVYEITEDVLRPSMESLMDGIEGQVEKTIDILKDTKYGEFRENMLKQAEELGLTTGQGIAKYFSSELLTTLKEDLNEVDWGEIFESDIDSILNKFKYGGENVEKGPGEEQDFILRSSGEVTSFTNEDDIIGAKKGGPLDKLMDKTITNNSTNSMGGTITLDGTANINITISSDNPNIEFSSEDSRKMKDSIIRTVTAMFNNGGSPDGANIPQGSKGFIQTM